MDTIISTNQTKIAYQKTGSGTPLLMVHGTNGSHAHWNMALPMLTKHFTVYAMERRGRGESGDDSTYTIEHEFEDVAALANTIGGPVDVFGHSFGAACVLGAARYIPTLRRMILYEPPMLQAQQTPQRSALLDCMEQLLSIGEREQVVITLLRDMLGVPQAMVDRVRQAPNWPAQVAAAHTIPRELRQSHRYAPDLAALQTITVPTAFFLGSGSPAFFKQTTETLHSHLSNSQIVVLEGQQHSAMLTAPELFASEIIRFLE
jgi:pimeloyl-ACP methyl ester carboxylesterase